LRRKFLERYITNALPFVLSEPKTCTDPSTWSPGG
jgi:hypothetical protein